MSAKPIIILAIFTLTIFTACKGRKTVTDEINEVVAEDSNLSLYDYESFESMQQDNFEYPDTIIGDTVWFYPSTTTYTWIDSIETKGFMAVVTVNIDTNDLIIDTIKSTLGGKIAVGYNHYYTIDFYRKGQPWFTAKFNKKQHLESLIGGTDFWLSSNLNIVQRLIYNKTYGKFIIEFSTDPNYNYGPAYYLVFDTTGGFTYKGTVGTWGGSATDGSPFLTADNKSFITCYEIFNFEHDTSLSLAEFTALANYKTFGIASSSYRWLYAMRTLSKNNFLLIFNRENDEPNFNALILNSDTSVVGHFRYYGMSEDMDAMLMFKYAEKIKKYVLFDLEREKLIFIDENDYHKIKEISLESMYEVGSDTIDSEKYEQIDFEVFGKYKFYCSLDDSIIYYDFNNLE